MATLDDKRRIPLLTVQNWSHWSKVVYRELLSQGDLWDIVSGTEIAPVLPNDPNQAQRRAANQFRMRKNKAIGLLLTNISQELFTYLPDLPDDPVQIWQVMGDRCQPNTTTSFYALRRQHNQMSLRNGEDPLDWLRQRKELYDRLTGMNHAVE